MSLCFGNKDKNLQDEIDKVCRSIIEDIETHTNKKQELTNEEESSFARSEYSTDTTNFAKITSTQNKLYKIMQKYDLYI